METAAHGPRPVAWWRRLIATAEHFDAAYLLEELAGELVPRIANHLLRREVELAVATVTRHLLRPANEEFVEDAEAGRERLTNTLERLGIDLNAAVDPADEPGRAEAAALCHAVVGDYATAVARAERILGTPSVLHTTVTALRFERFDGALAERMLEAGRSPEDAVRAGQLVGAHLWWPAWLLEFAGERAMAGDLDEALIAAMDQCAYAPLTSAQVHVARKLLSRDPVALAAAADNLEHLGEPAAADALRAGDLTPAALAAKLMFF